MKISRLIAVGTVAASASLMAAVVPAWAANNDVAPTIEYLLPYTKDYSYVSESLAVAGDGSYWLCVEESAAPFAAFAFKFAAGSSGVDTPVQTLNLDNAQGGCTDLTVGSNDNLYVSMSVRIEVYAPDATGSASPLRTITNASFDIGYMAMDTLDRLYLTNNEDIWVYSAGANGTDLPYRIINGSNLGGSDLYVAADADGVVSVADYDEDKVRVFGATNDGPIWDREFWLDNDAANSFGGITSNGDKIYVTYQDGAAPGIYVFPSNSEGATTAFESWSGANVVSTSDDALNDVGVGGCAGEMITFEGYNDRILTWDNLTTECPDPITPDPESPAAALPATGVDATAVGGIAAGAGALALVGLGLVVARRRQLS